jgi:hypothetical protein
MHCNQRIKVLHRKILVIILTCRKAVIGMKKWIAIISIVIITGGPGFSASMRKQTEKPAHRRNRIAVIKGRYDKVDTVLDNFHIPYDVLKLKDLENPSSVDGYRAIFVPSGIDTPLEESLDFFASNVRYKSVALKPDFYEVDKKKIARTIWRFIKSGGSAYFSGYSFEYLQAAFDIFDYFAGFPYMGMPARVEAVLDHDMARFSMKGRMALYFDHPGWIAVKSAKDSEVMAHASYETPRGVRTGPVSVFARRGRGEILYTCYDSTLFSPFRRFNVYRIAGAYLLNPLEDMAKKWNQRITARLVDSIQRYESSRMYRIDLEKGRNAVYFHSAGDFYQIDFINRDKALIESHDLFERDQAFFITSKSNDFCYIRLYPSTPARYGMFAIVSASGMRIFPYFYQIMAALTGALIIASAVAAYRLFLAKGYTGRWRG